MSDATIAIAEICAPVEGSPTLCVAWSDPGDPQPFTHFQITYTDPSAPRLELIAGSNWTVYSKAESNPDLPGAIGDIQFFSPEDMTLKLARPDGTAAATSVKNIDLRPSMNHGSDLVAGSTLAGDVLGAIHVVRGGQGDGRLDLTAGGTIWGPVESVTIDHLAVSGSLRGPVNATTIDELTVSNEVTGHITAFDVERITVGGSMTGGADIDFLRQVVIGGDAGGTFMIQYLEHGDMPGLFEVGGNLDNGTIMIRQQMVGSTLRVRKEVTRTGSIGISELRTHCPPPPTPCLGAHSAVILNEQAGDTWGNVTVGGINAHQSVVIHGALQSSGSLAVSGDITGRIEVRRGGSGTVTAALQPNAIVGPGTVVLGETAQDVWSGMAEFERISNAQTNQIGSLRFGILKGSVQVHGAVSGRVDGATITETGRLIVDQSQSGDVVIEGDVDGEVRFGGSKGVAGELRVRGDLAKSARIYYQGLANGDIYIHGGARSGSLVHLEGGLGSQGSVTINADAGNGDAEGVIQVGSFASTVPPSAIVFDGSIRVLRGGAGGGDLLGTISVTGCHATSAPLDICICGENHGEIRIRQGGCANHVGVQCLGGC